MDGEDASINGLHVRFQGFTATFRIPFLASGTRLSLEVPSYSTIHGLVKCCLGWRTPTESYRAGFIFTYSGRFIDMERTWRLELDRQGRIRPSTATALAFHESLTFPRLDLYIDRPEWYNRFRSPDGTPLLGRSQDVAWVTSVRKIKLRLRSEGVVSGTLLPYRQPEVTGKLARLADRFDNRRMGYVRRATGRTLYHVVPIGASFRIHRKSLFHPSDSENPDDVVYLHAWSA